jgi:hypothetical protein
MNRRPAEPRHANASVAPRRDRIADFTSFAPVPTHTMAMFGADPHRVDGAATGPD